MMQSRIDPMDSNQTKLLNSIMRLRSQFSKVDKTIFLYDLYEDRVRNKVELDNLNTLALVLLKKDFKVNVIQKKRGKKQIIIQELIEENQFKESGIEKQVFDVQESKGEEVISDNIVIYTNHSHSLRVVVLPIQKQAINIDIIKKSSEELKQKDEKKKTQFQVLAGQARKKASTQWELEKKEEFEKACQMAAEKHEKALRIKAIQQEILNKTTKVSVCCLTEISDRRYNTFKGFEDQFSNLFQTSADFIPQFIMHQFDPEDQENLEEKSAASNQKVSTIFSLINNQFGVHRFNALDQKYYFDPSKIRTKFYSNLENSKDQAILFGIKEYIANFNKICLNTATVCINVVLRAMELVQKNITVSSSENIESPDNTNTLCEGSLRDIQDFPTFKDIFEKYISESLWLPGTVEFQNIYKQQFYNITPQPGQPLLSESIEPLAHIHLFYKIGNEILKEVSKVDMESKSNLIEVLKVWKKGLKTIFSLIFSENGAFLQRPENQDYQCPDKMRFFNFLNFTLDSIEWIKKITGRDMGLVNDLKAKLEKLNMKGEKILSLILKIYKNLFEKKQPVHFYNILIQIIRDNSSSQNENDLQFIFLLIHCKKADLIAKNHSSNQENVIQAIKSYSTVILAVPSLNENKRNLIDIEDIKDKMAKLFKIIGLYQQAADIFTSMRKHEKASKCHKMILPLLPKKKRVEKLLEWGEIQENDAEYDLALSYYRQAYENAKDTADKQKAIKCKKECLAKLRQSTDKEEQLLMDNFLEDGNLEAYTSKHNISGLLQKAKNKLYWDSKSSRSMIEVDEEPLEQSSP